MRSRFTLVAGVRVHWREAGSGDPLVLVHGIGVSGRYLVPTAERLASEFHVLVPDLPGFGQSEKPPRALGVGWCARALAAWLDVVGVAHASFLGNSMGCQTLVRLAMHEPERVGRLVLVGPTIDAQARSFVRQALRLAVDTAREPPSLAALVAWDYAVYGPWRFMITAHSALNDPIEDNVVHVEAPTLVVRGTRDALVSAEFAHEVAARLPHGRFVGVDGTPHAVNYAAPDALARVVREFLSDRSAVASD